MYSPRILLAAATLAVSAVFQASAQTVSEVTVIKGSEWVQMSAADPVIDPRSPGPGYGGPYNFRVRVDGTDIGGLSPKPQVTLAPGSQYPMQNPARHALGVLTYNANNESWAYGSDGNNFGGPSEAAREISFAPGVYTFTVAGETFGLNFPATAFPPNTPKVTLTGGYWSGGKYLIEAGQALTITTNSFTNYDKNVDGVMEIAFDNDPDDLIDQLVFHSANPAGPNFLTVTVPPNTLTTGRDYVTEVSFYAVTDKRGDIATRLDAAAYQRTTTFTIGVVPPPVPGALATLHAMGDLSGGSNFSEVRAATKSGGVIYGVGDSNSYFGNNQAGDTAAMWSSTNGIVPLPNLVNQTTGTPGSLSAADITPDGIHIASRTRATAGGATRAVRVTRDAATGALTNLNLGVILAGGNSLANAISSDGSILYGTSAYVSGKQRAVRYTTNPVTITAIPFLNAVTDDTSTPADQGVSANGQVMVGRSVASGTTSSLGLGNRAFRYVHADGGGTVSAIPLLDPGLGSTWSGAVAVSPDGNLTLVRGNSASAPQGEFYLHNATTGALTSYGTPNGSRSPGGIMKMTPDGSVVATPFTPADNPIQMTYVRNAHGWHDFQTMVERAGVDLTGWNLHESLFGMSPDATLVWGRGVHDGRREGFVVEFAPGYLANYKEPEIFSTPHESIVGAWSFGDTTTIGQGGVVVFLANGYYVHIQTASPGEGPSGVAGFERGQYKWDHVTGAITFRTLIDTNGDVGLSGLNDVAGATATVNGDSLVFFTPGEGTTPATRVLGASPIVGAFGNTNLSDNSAVVVFLPNGYYFMAQDGDATPAGSPNGRDGMEWGTYLWDAGTGALSVATLVDTNGQWGLSHPSGAMTAAVSDNRLTLTLSDASGADTLLRVGASAAIASIPPGNNQTVTVGTEDENVALTFVSVGAGEVTVKTSTSGPPPPDGFLVSNGSGPSVYYDISTTATFTGQVEIVIQYDPAGFADVTGLRLFHFEGGAWTDITTWHNIAHSKLYGLTSSFSPFALFEPTLMVKFEGPPVGTALPIGSSVTLAAKAEGHVPGRTYNVSWRLQRGADPVITFAHVATTADLSRVIPVPAVGVYSVALSVVSDDGLKAEASLVEPDLLPGSLIVYDPSGGFVTGGGSIYSPPGAHVALPDAEGPATFGFVSKYQKGAKKPTGNTQFDFHTGGLRFKSTDYEWLVIAGSKAQYKGVGTINGGGDYAFMITANDSPSGDRFRIKITDRLTDALVYDNQRGSADGDELHDGTLIRSGSIVIHK